MFGHKIEALLTYVKSSDFSLERAYNNTIIIDLSHFVKSCENILIEMLAVE